MSDKSHHHVDRAPLMLVASTAVAVAATSAAAVFHKTLVQPYGWEGALRYLWEGKPYPQDVQDALDSLSEVEESRTFQISRLSAMEEALEHARLDTVDDSKTSEAIVKKWIERYRPNNLERSLGETSHKLDKLAAQVDGVILKEYQESSLKVIQEIRKRKKLLSKQLVLDMERCDALMASYQVLHE